MKAGWIALIGAACVVILGWMLIRYANGIDQSCAMHGGVLVRSSKGYTCIKAQIIVPAQETAKEMR